MVSEFASLAIGGAGLAAQLYFVIYGVMLGSTDSFTVAYCFMFAAANILLVIGFKVIIIFMGYIKVIMRALQPVLLIGSGVLLIFAMTLLALNYASMDQVCEIFAAHYRRIMWWLKLVVH